MPNAIWHRWAACWRVRSLAMGAVIAEQPLISGRGTRIGMAGMGGLADLPVTIAAQLVPPNSRAVIVAPHPDDEVLACGGLLQQLHAQGSHIGTVGGHRW
jgi:hypothetical protein